MIAGLISNRIRSLRFHHNEMSQAELGQRIGMTRQTIAAIEGGKYSPSLEAAFRIAHVFNVSLEAVFQWSATSDDPKTQTKRNPRASQVPA
jgi:putative transcriptional regulator